MSETRVPPGPRFRVDNSPAAQRDIHRLAAPDAARLRGPILALAWEPRPPGARKLRGSDFWRIRLGGLRVVYAMVEDRALVIILRVARRDEATYRRLR
ncbi:MAG: type II toxin-antitoxin system RelE/ParE family toxin [Chloroflexi bacterium]|nr:type II toxin-antitoxin system RelE/ParE family toxin [Chloroflexota bacterium]